jgi:plastocyanin
MPDAMRFPLFASSIAALLTVAACSSKPTSAPPASQGGKHVDAATTGTLSGRVTFDGVAPAPQPLKMSSDPACAEGSGPNPTSDAVLVGKDAGLQNVFVYVKDGLDPAYSFDTPTESIKFDQHGCRYVPHVFGVRVNQPIEIINDDNTFHNVHALPKTNREFNHGMSPKGDAMKHVFTVPEVMVRFKCDVHGWMTAYVGVMAHPFFAVTDSTGSFDIKGLPPGTYTIEAWHERFGTKTQKITVAEHQNQQMSFSFAALP